MKDPDWLTQARAEGRITETGVKMAATSSGPEPVKEPKYRNQRTECDGITFDSKKEAARYRELKLMEKVGSIMWLKTQVPHPIEVNNQVVCRYYADFTYMERDEAGVWWPVVEDVKSAITRKNPVYRLKRRLMKAALGITIREIYNTKGG